MPRAANSAAVSATARPQEEKKPKKEIFVDDCVAVRLENPLDPKLRNFLLWLSEHGSLVLSPKIIAEYAASLSRGGSSTFIALLSKLQRENRQVHFSNEQLKNFSFAKKMKRNLRSNEKDWWHLKAVLLSPRKIALSFDCSFIFDVNNFPGYGASASSVADDLRYK